MPTFDCPDCDVHFTVETTACTVSDVTCCPVCGGDEFEHQPLFRS